jgi:hypothetical protein
MQILAKQDAICDLTEEHELIIEAALTDGVITPAERAEIAASARRIKLASQRQACRTRIGIRMIRGGELDRHVMIEIRDYQRLLDEEKATKRANAMAA